MAWLQTRAPKLRGRAPRPDRVLGYGHQSSTARQHFHAVRTFGKYLRREGLMVEDLSLAYGPKTPARPLPQYLTVTEQEAVLATLAADRTLLGRRDYALVATLLLMGLRAEECATLRVADLAFEGKQGTARVIGKGQKMRELDIIPRLATILRDYLATVRPRLLRTGVLAPAPPWVFLNAKPSRSWQTRRAGEPLLTRSVWALVQRRLTPLVGRSVWPHLLRHSFASRLRSAGADLGVIQEFLGHASIDTTMIYAHLSTSARRADLERFLEVGRKKEK